MKTFRFFATLLVIALCAGFTSCSDDDDENPLVGTWVNIENRNSVEYKEVMTINSDGTGCYHFLNFAICFRGTRADCTETGQ